MKIPLKTVQCEKFQSVHPNIKTIDDLSEGQDDTIFTFEESNFISDKPWLILKSSMSEEQFNFLSTLSFKFHRLFLYVETRPNLKDGNQFTSYAGMAQYHQVFNGTLAFDSKYFTSLSHSFYLEYPERWLNIIEQRCLLQGLMLNYPNSSFTIKTHSVYIIQCTHRESIGVRDVQLYEDVQDEENIFTYQNFITNNIHACVPSENDSGLQIF